MGPHFERIMGWLRSLHEMRMMLQEVLKDGRLLEMDNENKASEGDK